VYCRKCEYSLKAARTDLCPECGTRFDRSDPESVFISPPGPTPWTRRFRHALWIVNLPLAAQTCAGIACWVIATFRLGHPPRTNIDKADRLAIGAPLGFWHATLGIAMVSVPALLLAWIVLAGWPSTPSAARRSRRQISLSAVVLLIEVFLWYTIGGWIVS
jgi:hypothetical protein